MSGLVFLYTAFADTDLAGVDSDGDFDGLILIQTRAAQRSSINSHRPAAQTATGVKDCADSPADWMGSSGRNCDFYAENALCTTDGGYGSGWGADFGTFEDYADADGHTANTACCACGGGTAAEELMPAAEEACSESPAGWVGSSGRNCEFYADNKLCTADGDYGEGWGSEFGTFEDYAAKDGSTAITACCQCGGGQGAEKEKKTKEKKSTDKRAAEPAAATSAATVEKIVEVPTYIPTVHDNTDETCDGSDSPWGLKGQKHEVKSLDECEELCSSGKECRFIQYQPSKSMCHLYSDCSKTRSCDSECARTLRRLVASTFLPMEGYDKTEQTCDGTDTEWGTKGQIHDTDSQQDCQQLCIRDPECRFIQFQVSVSRCHLYQGCNAPRPCADECERTLKRLTAGVFIPTVYDKTEQTCDGTDSPWGAKGKIEEAESIDECKALCSHTEECQFIQFQEEKSECHMYQDCSEPRSCNDECERTLQRLVPGTLIPTIYDNGDETCDGTDTEWGTEGKIEDAETLEECNELCGDEDACHFIQFQPEKKQCHLYMDCFSSRACDDKCARTLKRMKVLHASG